MSLFKQLLVIYNYIIA